MQVAAECSVASVVINSPVDRSFDYRIPAELRGKLAPGARVLVPFGPKTRIGYCVDLLEESSFPRLKSVLQLIDEEPLISGSLFQLAKWMSREYLCSFGEALEAVLPAGVRKQISSKTVPFVSLAVPDPEAIIRELEKKAPKQAKGLAVLAEIGAETMMKELSEESGCSYTIFRELEKKGFVRIEQRSVTDDPMLAGEVSRVTPPALTPEQSRCLDAILPSVDEGRSDVFLLQGVTGSGKTEVYLQGIDRAVSQGKQAIVLVPEISLTPQTVRRFRERFGRVAVQHSHLTDGQRYEQWQAVRSGEAQVVVGARSALFSPTRNLGLVVIDEEHENSFKQGNKPRYHARETAVERGRLEGFPVILGSATPALETFHAAHQGRYKRLLLPHRIAQRELPRVELIDMKEESADTKRFSILSRRLLSHMADAIEQGKQILLFLNRRGFSTCVHCPRCGFTLRCPHCDIALIFHKDRNTAMCHYCLWRQDPPKDCPECNMPGVKYLGIGTQRVEEELKWRFPDVTIDRMDRDTTRKRLAYQEILERFRTRKTTLLIGTQMIAKGHDFPDVTMVGVISADTALNFPDFRAAERTFQLLTQVAGRAGRGDDPGRVLVQTNLPNHYSIQAASRHDFESFAIQELDARRQLRYPPFSRLIRFGISSSNEEAGTKEAQKLKEHLEKLQKSEQWSDVEILGPAPCPLARIENRFRFHLILKLPADAPPPHSLRGIAEKHSRGHLRVEIDVDPASLL